MKALYISLLLIFAVQFSNCQAQGYNEPAYLITNKDSLINVYRNKLILPKECEISGKSFVMHKVNLDGSVSDVQIIKGLENCPKADSIAIEIVKKVRYKPEIKNSEPVEVTKVLFIPFYDE